jgi:hypothetical protein
MAIRPVLSRVSRFWCFPHRNFPLGCHDIACAPIPLWHSYVWSLGHHQYSSSAANVPSAVCPTCLHPIIGTPFLPDLLDVSGIHDSWSRNPILSSSALRSSKPPFLLCQVLRTLDHPVPLFMAATTGGGTGPSNPEQARARSGLGLSSSTNLVMMNRKWVSMSLGENVL